jgi:hypothetical protein
MDTAKTLAERNFLEGMRRNMMRISPFALTVAILIVAVILILSACSAGGEPTAGVAATPTSQALAANTTTPAAQPTARPTATPTVEPTSQPSPTPVPPEPASAGSCQNPYYPVVAGASWTYQMSGPVGDTFTRSIVNVRENGFDDQDVFSAGVTRQGSWECREGNLISLTPASGPSVAAAGMQMNATVESNTGLTFPADPRPGMEWTQNLVLVGRFEQEDMSMEARSVIDLSCKAVGMERVSVPAGDFEALRVDCATQFAISISGMAAFNTTVNGSAWYAPGVGWVKSSDASEMGVTEVVLLSYTIP